jgi:hypothetical protein
LHDETRRNYTTVGALVGFMKSQSGKSLMKRRRWTPTLMRRKGLLGPYLEFGEEGHLRFKMTVCEILGFVALPVMLPLRILGNFLEQQFAMLFDTAKMCEGGAAEETDSISCSYFAQALSARWLRSVNKETGFPKIFDYEKSRLIMSVLGSLQPYMGTPRWILRIMWMAPQFYYDYYVDGSKYLRLPQRRQACLCREGLRVAKLEMRALETKIGELEAELAVRDSIRHEEILSAEGPLKDFGPDMAWKVVDGKEIESKIGINRYKFTFFKEIWQDNVMIGSFTNWGTTRSLTQNDNAKPYYLVTISLQIKASVIEYINGILNYWYRWLDKRVDMQAISNSFTWLVGLVYHAELSDASFDSTEIYNAQFFAGGDQCFNGPRRSAVTLFVCARDHVILDVVEIDICVYQVSVGTPLACTEDQEVGARERLEELKVYGYAKTTPTQNIVDIDGDDDDDDDDDNMVM